MSVDKMIAAAVRTLRVLTWTPSRYAKWKECPRKVLFEDLMKMCPVCFKGRISGGFDGQPVACDTCDGEQPTREPLERGNRLDAALTLHVSAPTGIEAQAQHLIKAGVKPGSEAAVVHTESLMESMRHPGIAALVKKLRRAKGVSTQESIVLDSKWRRVSQFTKGAWARLKLDVLVLKPKQAHVIDWKSGNIDRGEIRERDEYHDSMRAYQMAVLSVYPQAECEVEMVFLDAPPKAEKFSKSLPVLKRADLDVERSRWEDKLRPMFMDDTFAPRPGYYCRWCHFSKTKGGPCPY